MEPRFGVDFSDVRVHDAPADRVAADRIGARAFTHRRHIWMGAGESAENRRLMAHELTHVVQQTVRTPLRSGLAMRVGAPAEPELQRGWLANKAEGVARRVPGYTLLSVILGKSPITDKPVSRTAENLIGGFLGLLPVIGEEIFQRLKETRALQRAFEWVTDKLSELNITWSRVTGLVSDFIDEMPSFSPLATAKRIFRPLIDDIVSFISAVKDKILEFIIRGALALVGSSSTAERIWAVIEQARETISLILEDPLGFARNLVKAVVQGFIQFKDRIGAHLKKGLMGWLFGALKGADIELPAKLDFKGVVSIGLQVVGLTYARFRAMLVTQLGASGEKKVAYLEKSVEVVKILLKEGFLGLWQRFLQMIDGFRTTVIDGIWKFVTESLVKGAVTWIAGLSNPIGGIVKVALSIYNIIKTFIERIDQILDVAGAIFSSIGAIAKGQVKAAADFIETTIASTIPVVLAFVAALIPVSGVTRSIKEIITKLRKPVDDALKKMVNFLVKKAKKLFSKILRTVNKKRKLPGHGFKVGEEDHSILAEQKDGRFQIMIASEEPKRSDAVQSELAEEALRAEEFGDDSKCFGMFKAAFAGEIDEAEISAAKVRFDQQKDSTKKPAKKAGEDMKDAGAKLTKLGPCIADNPFFDDQPEEGGFIRAREPRIPEVEGGSGLHKDRSEITAQIIKQQSELAGLGPRGLQKLSDYYENDHIAEVSMAKAVQSYVQGELARDAAEGDRERDAPLEEPLLGEIATRAFSESGDKLPAITIYRPIHRQKSNEDAKQRNHGAIIAAARAQGTTKAKIAKLREGVVTELQAGLDSVAAKYGADKAASELIRGKVRAGMATLGPLNSALYGAAPGAAPAIAKGAAEDGKGSNLPLDGDPAAGIPDFAEVEGAYSVHGAAPKGVGEYIEFDHVIEATLAKQAQELTLGTPAIKAEVAGELGGRIAGMKESAEAKAARTELAAARLDAAFNRKVFAGKPVSAYDSGGAGTVGLYRP
ncbi:MAG: DUF4157 domain-containing protein, partial [Paracoccaceae bacterium]